MAKWETKKVFSEGQQKTAPSLSLSFCMLFVSGEGKKPEPVYTEQKSFD